MLENQMERQLQGGYKNEMYSHYYAILHFIWLVRVQRQQEPGVVSMIQCRYVSF